MEMTSKLARAAAGRSDTEKHTTATQDGDEVSSDSKSDDESTYKQDGVKRVEAITTVLTKKTLWTMFILWVLCRRYVSW